MSSTKKTKASKVPSGGKAAATAKTAVKSKAKPLAAAKPAKPAAKAAAAKAQGNAKPASKAHASQPKSVAKTAVAKIAVAKSVAMPPPAKPVAAPAARSQVRAAQNKPEKKLTARAPTRPVVLTPDYRPSENEPFMSEMHRAYFRQKLMTWKDEIIRQTKETLVILHEDSVQHADIADRATSETDRSLELRARDRQRKLIAKIDAAISRIDDGSYGYCEDTGEPIGLKRLEARPIATLSLEAQERHERREKVYRED